MIPSILGFSVNLCRTALTMAWEAYGGAASFHDGTMIYENDKNQVYLPLFYVYDFNQTLYVSIRGSSSQKDWYTDFNYTERYEDFGDYKLHVHGGFFNSSINVFNQIKDIIANYPGRIIFTGHSYGASVATVLGIYCMTHPDTAKNAQRMGVLGFAAAPAIEKVPEPFHDQVCSFVYETDIVPTLSIINAYDTFKDFIPKSGATKALLKILIKTAVTILKDKKGLANSLYNGIMAASDQIVDDLCAYSVDQTSCHIGQVVGITYHLNTVQGKLSEDMVDPATLNILSISQTCADDHNIQHYSDSLNEKSDD